MLGQSLREVHSGEHWRQLEPYIDRALSGESVSFEMAERNHAGQQRYMLRSYVPNRQANGEVAGIFVLIRTLPTAGAPPRRCIRPTRTSNSGFASAPPNSPA